MALLHSTLEQLRDQFAELAKLGRIDAWLAEEPIFDPEEAAAEDWRLLSLVEGYRTLYRWPIQLGVILYRQPPDDPKLRTVLGPDGRLDFADPPIDSRGRLVVLNKERKHVSISCGAVRKVRLAGDADAAAKFGVLAQAAGELVIKSSPRDWKWLARETVEISDPVWRWILALFDLAWARVPDSGIVPSVDKTWRFPKAVKIGDGGARKRSETVRGKPLHREPLGLRAESARSGPARPWWYSELADVSLASVFMLNVLLDAVSTSCGVKQTYRDNPDHTRTKRSTRKGDARAKIIAALTKHHQYEADSCLNSEPIGVRKLARMADVAPSSVSEFFKAEFKGRPIYQQACRDVHRLVRALKQLNGEYPAHFLL